MAETSRLAKFRVENDRDRVARGSAAHQIGGSMRETLGGVAVGTTATMVDPLVYAARQGSRQVENVARGFTGAPPNVSPISFRAASNAVGNALLPSSPDITAGGVTTAPEGTQAAQLPSAAGADAASATGSMRPQKVRWDGEGGAYGQIELSGPPGSFNTPDTAPQPQGPIRENSIEAASAEYMRRNPGADHPVLDTMDFGVQSVSRDRLRAAQSAPFIRAQAQGATPFEAPEFTWKQVEDPRTGRIDPQKVPTGRTVTRWRGPNGGDFASEGDALAGSIAMRNSLSGADSASAAAERNRVEAALMPADTASQIGYRGAQGRAGELNAEASLRNAETKRLEAGKTKYKSGTQEIETLYGKFNRPTSYDEVSGREVYASELIPQEELNTRAAKNTAALKSVNPDAFNLVKKYLDETPAEDRDYSYLYDLTSYYLGAQATKSTK